MSVGVFGKLPARRDYVQNGVDQGLMALMDPWLQACQQESRGHLGEAWLDVYLTAPIWRFWMGPGTIGQTVLGALMPSVDGVGRYFPLAVLGTFETSVPAPHRDRHDAWFAAAEHALLSALADDGTYEDLIDAVGQMPEPGLADGDPDDLAGKIEGCLDDLIVAMSVWWVPGDPDRGQTARAHMWRGLPPAAAYAMMIGQPDAPMETETAMGGQEC
ncbi:MAG: type VI secretion system-associated protein TagF [Pseudomonadota bacterium]